MGTGCLDLGDVALIPTVGPLHLEPGEPGNGFKSRFSHDSEIAHPGYYKVFLEDPKVQVELTATARVAMHRYTFPDSDQAHVILDTLHSIGANVIESDLRRENSTVISGHRKMRGWAQDRDVWFVIEFSQPFQNFGFEADGVMSKNVEEASGTRVKGYVDFQTKAATPLIVKVALSPTGWEEAHKNLEAEMPGWDFDAVRQTAASRWSDSLGVIDVQSADPSVRKTFYSNLYQTMQAPILYNDADGTYRGQDRQNHPSANFQKYTEFSLWDIYRAEAPLLTLTQPARVPDFVSTLLADYQQLNQHALPKWPLWGNETWCMIGYHSVPVIVDAYFKHLVRSDDVAALYAAMRDTAMQDREGLGDYKKLGYIPSDSHGQSVSTTLEYAFDDACLAKMAQALGHDDDAKMFAARAESYRNVYDPATQFMRAKTKDGQWKEPFDSHDAGTGAYTEADAWQYAFAVQQDEPALVQLMGGDAPFVKKLDALFAEASKITRGIPDISGLIGQYSQGDEQCHHVAYLYNYAGAPWLTQKHVREVMAKLYSEKPDGLCGNADCGQMNAWYVFSALGFYPVNPVTGVYVIGSPAVDRATCSTSMPRSITARRSPSWRSNNSAQNIYIQSATLNGQPLTRSWITHAEITAGGELDFVMGPEPNKSWGAAPADCPPAGFPVP